MSLNKLNKLGMELLKFKEELTKEHTPLVRESLIFSISKSHDGKKINEQVLKQIQDDTSFDDFKELLEYLPEYIKEKDKLLKEYNLLLDELNMELQMHEIEGFKTEIFLEKDEIHMVKSILISEEYLQKYFGVDDEEFILLMKKKGFAEKFAILRLNKISNDIIKKVSQQTILTSAESSLVYYDMDKKGFCIDIILAINVDDLSMTGRKQKVMAEINVTGQIVENITRDRLRR